MIKGNRIYDELKEEFLQKYMPPPNADPNEDFIENEKYQNSLQKNPNVDEMI